MEWFDSIASLIALTILEIVLGIDNLVFLSILTETLPKTDRKKARRWGLTFAWVTRLLLLASAIALSKLSTPIFEIFSWKASIRDLFLLSGGAFLIAKATQEISQEVGEVLLEGHHTGPKKNSFWRVVFQIAFMDIIFSLDSVLTAIGLTNIFMIMAFAITLAILVMIYASEIVSLFIETHPTIKMLALSFLILIGMVLVADAFAFHIPRGYVYFAMGFSLSVETLNLIRRGRRDKNK